MDRRRQTRTAPPWLREPDPSVPQPTATGRAILRMWIEDQLRLISARSRRRSWRRHPRAGA